MLYDDVYHRFVNSLSGSETRGAGNLTVVGLRFADEGRPDYMILEEGLGKSLVEVTEVSESGRVGGMRVTNHAETRLLIVEGDHLHGVKQDRVANLSILLDRKSTTDIPVSCVERGRWSYKSDKAHATGSHSPYHLKSKLAASVTHCLNETGTPGSDQRAVWAQVDEYLGSTRTPSGTSSLADVFDHTRDQLAAMHERLGRFTGCTGLAFFVDGEFLALEVFDRPDTFDRYQEKMLKGSVLDALLGACRAPAPKCGIDSLQTAIDRLRGAELEAHPGVGLGENLRFKADALEGTCLVHEGRIVHLAVYAS